MNDTMIFALALKTMEKTVVVDGPFATRYEALGFKTDMQRVVSLSTEKFNDAVQWSD